MKDNTVTGQLATSISSNDDCTRLWHKRLGHTGENSLQGLAKKDLLKGVKTCKLNFCEHCVIDKKIKVKFGTAIPCTEGILGMFIQMLGDLLRRHLLEVITTL